MKHLKRYTITDDNGANTAILYTGASLPAADRAADAQERYLLERGFRHVQEPQYIRYVMSDGTTTHVIEGHEG